MKIIYEDVRTKAAILASTAVAALGGNAIKPVTAVAAPERSAPVTNTVGLVATAECGGPGEEQVTKPAHVTVRDGVYRYRSVCRSGDTLARQYMSYSTRTGHARYDVKVTRPDCEFNSWDTPALTGEAESKLTGEETVFYKTNVGTGLVESGPKACHRPLTLEGHAKAQLTNDTVFDLIQMDQAHPGTEFTWTGQAGFEHGAQDAYAKLTGEFILQHPKG